MLRAKYRTATLCTSFFMGWIAGNWSSVLSGLSSMQVNSSTPTKISVGLSVLPEGLKPKVWSSWPQDRPFPCFKEASGPVHKGFVFIKPMKVGGSTAGGIHRRISRNIQRRLNLTHSCLTRCNHGSARTIVGWQDPSFTRDQLFLWTIIREPMKRTISQFFHFHVSRLKVEPTDKNFQTKIKNSIVASNGHYAKFLAPGEDLPHNSTSDFCLHQVQAILNSYDFIAVTDRMDESIVVLQLLLGLTTGDVLYLSAKQNGGFDDGRFKGRCTFIVPSYVSPGMKRFFLSDPWWLDHSRLDKMLYAAVNQSLDLTINESLGKEVFAAELRRFIWAKQVISERCSIEDAFPCTAGGEKIPNNETGCLWNDAGCGTTCIDKVVLELGL